MHRSLRSRVASLVSVYTAVTLTACGGGGATGAGEGDGGSSLGGHSQGSGGASDATSSGGTAGSMQSGGSAAGGGVKVECKDRPLCDDFEDALEGGAPDAARWSIVTPNCSGTGKITVDGTQAHSGTKSVKVTGEGGYCNHVFLANNSAIAALGKVIYGRFFLKISDALGDGHTTFMAMKDIADAGGKDLRMGGQNKVLMWNRESDDATLPVLSPTGTAKSLPPAAQRWLCVEFMVDGNKSGMQTWVDGVEIEGLHLDGTPSPDIDQQWLNKSGWKPELRDWKLGWESYAGQAMTLWFDDVALGSQRIGCQ